MFVTLVDAQLFHFVRKPYKDIVSICFAVCLFNCLTLLQYFLLEDMIFRSKYLVCYSTGSFFDVYMENIF